MANYDEDRDVNFEIVEQIGVISTQNTGWTKELNLISWNGGVPKYDIREWDPFHERMSKGITLHEREMRQVVELLKRRRTYSSRSRRKDAEHRASDAQGDTLREKSTNSGASESCEAEDIGCEAASCDVFTEDSVILCE